MMKIYQIINLLFAASIPIVVLVVVGRNIVSVYRSLRVRRFKFALYSVLAIAGILALFAGIAVIWFGYAVGHGKKDIWSGVILITLSVAPIYGSGYGLWRLARFLDEKSSGVRNRALHGRKTNE